MILLKLKKLKGGFKAFLKHQILYQTLLVPLTIKETDHNLYSLIIKA